MASLNFAEGRIYMSFEYDYMQQLKCEASENLLFRLRTFQIGMPDIACGLILPPLHYGRISDDRRRASITCPDGSTEYHHR